MNEAEMEAGLAVTPGYRYADEVNGQLFVAGQVPHDGDAQLVGVGDSGAQATRCLDNLRTLIEVRGFELEDVRHLTVYVVGVHQNLLDAWTAVTAWFDPVVPPATLLGVSLLGHSDQLVEVDAAIVRST